MAPADPSRSFTREAFLGLLGGASNRKAKLDFVTFS